MFAELDKEHATSEIFFGGLKLFSFSKTIEGMQFHLSEVGRKVRDRILMATIGGCRTRICRSEISSAKSCHAETEAGVDQAALPACSACGGVVLHVPATQPTKALR